MHVNKFLKQLCVVQILLCLSPMVNAAPGSGGTDPDPDPTGVPLDLGVGTLVALGIGYAAKRKHDQKAKTTKYQGTMK